MNVEVIRGTPRVGSTSWVSFQDLADWVRGLNVPSSGWPAIFAPLWRDMAVTVLGSPQAAIDVLAAMIRNMYGGAHTFPGGIPQAIWNMPVEGFPPKASAGWLQSAWDGFVRRFQQFNPAMVVARAAALELIRRNYRALASQLSARPSVLVNVAQRWAMWGGNPDVLRAAVESGRALQPVGNVDRVDVIFPTATPPPMVPLPGPSPAPDPAPAAPAQLSTWAQVAASLLNVFFSMLGMPQGAPPAGGTAPPSGVTASVDRAVELGASPPPPPGGAVGGGSGLLWVVVGGVLVVIASRA